MSNPSDRTYSETHEWLKVDGDVLTIHLVTLTTGLGGLILYRVPDWNSAWLVIGMVGCMLAVIAILETAGRRSES